jgi:hypothetical protein
VELVGAKRAASQPLQAPGTSTAPTDTGLGMGSEVGCRPAGAADAAAGEPCSTSEQAEGGLTSAQQAQVWAGQRVVRIGLSYELWQAHAA